MPTEVLTPDDLAPIRQLLKQASEVSARNAVHIEQNNEGIKALRETQQANAEQIAKNAEGIAELKEEIAELKVITQRSFEEMAAMLTQVTQEAARDRELIRQEMSEFARQAAADRETIREAIAALFKHQTNGGGNS